MQVYQCMKELIWDYQQSHLQVQKSKLSLNDKTTLKFIYPLKFTNFNKNILIENFYIFLKTLD